MDENKSPQDFLNEIFEKSREPEPPIPQPRFEPPGGDDPLPAPPPEKSKRSSFYVYLAILFGAAFLMLLLAYFLQRRGNAAQAELLGQTEEENAALRAENERLAKRLEKEQARGAELEQTSARYWEDYLWELQWNDHSNLLNCLERFVDAGDYLMASVMIQDIDVMFNRHSAGWNNQNLTPAQERRYLELRDKILHGGACMYRSWGPTDEGLEDHADEEDWGGHYVEAVYIADGVFDQKALDTAGPLSLVFREYAISPAYAAQAIEIEFGPDMGGMEVLNSGAFKPSTVELFEEIKADLLERGYLEEIDGVPRMSPSAREMIFSNKTPEG